MASNSSDNHHDVVIIGAGIIGVAIASHLQAAGRRVLLIDRKGICAETSARNAGALAFSDILPLASPGILRRAPGWLLDPLGPLAIRPTYLPHILPWLIRFAMASRRGPFEAAAAAQARLMTLARDEFHSMLARIGASSMIHRDGSLELYESEAQFHAAEPGWACRREAGIDFEHVRGERLADLQPGLAKSIVAATYVPQWETVGDPFTVTTTIGQHVLDHGARLLVDEVRGISPAADQVQVLLTQQPALTCGQVVIAAGAWSRALTTPLGDTIPLDTERGYNTTLPRHAFDLRRQLIFSAHGFVATPLDSGIRIGGAVEFGGLTLPADFRRSDAMLATAKRLLPALQTTGGTQWMGFRPSLPDSLPVIDFSPASRRVAYAFGHGHLGLTQSGATARLITDLLLNRKPAIDPSAFRANRFNPRR